MEQYRKYWKDYKEKVDIYEKLEKENRQKDSISEDEWQALDQALDTAYAAKEAVEGHILHRIISTGNEAILLASDLEAKEKEAEAARQIYLEKKKGAKELGKKVDRATGKNQDREDFLDRRFEELGKVYEQLTKAKEDLSKVRDQRNTNDEAITESIGQVLQHQKDYQSQLDQAKNVSSDLVSPLKTFQENYEACQRSIKKFAKKVERVDQFIKKYNRCLLEAKPEDFKKRDQLFVQYINEFATYQYECVAEATPPKVQIEEINAEENYEQKKSELLHNFQKYEELKKTAGSLKTVEEQVEKELLGQNSTGEEELLWNVSMLLGDNQDMFKYLSICQTRMQELKAYQSNIHQELDKMKESLNEIRRPLDENTQKMINYGFVTLKNYIIQTKKS